MLLKTNITQCDNLKIKQTLSVYLQQSDWGHRVVKIKANKQKQTKIS